MKTVADLNPAQRFDIQSERVVVDVPRGNDGSQVLRLSHVVANTSDGKKAWHSLRILHRDTNGDFQPAKAAITIRHSEIGTVAKALTDEAAKYGKRSR